MRRRQKHGVFNILSLNFGTARRAAGPEAANWLNKMFLLHSLGPDLDLLWEWSVLNLMIKAYSETVERARIAAMW